MTVDPEQAMSPARDPEAQTHHGDSAPSVHAPKDASAPSTLPVRELRPGRPDVVPCFFIHDELGQTREYLDVAKRLPNGVPVYGVEPRRSDRAPIVHTSIESMAGDYVQRIRMTWPGGPYVVVGRGAGGALAHEVGRRLEESGAEVLLVGLIETDTPETEVSNRERANTLLGALRRVEEDGPMVAESQRGSGLTKRVSDLVRHRVETRLNRLEARARIALTDYIADREGTYLKGVSLQRVIEDAVSRFRPTPWACPAVLFLAADHAARSTDDAPGRANSTTARFSGWDAFCTRGMEVVSCPGAPGTLLREPHVEGIADRIRRVWAKKLHPQRIDALNRRTMVVIVNYRSAHLTLRNARSLLAAREAMPNLELVVVENDSGDAPALAQGLADPVFEGWVRLEVAPKNGGFAYGNNYAVRAALRSKTPPDYFLLLNPDSEVRAGAVETLVEFMEQNPSAGIAGAGLDNEDGSEWNVAFRFPSLVSEFDGGLGLGFVSFALRRRLVAQFMTGERAPIDWVPGAAMIVRREVFEDAGLMDEEYFLYFEETDFCLAAKRAGWDCWYVPDARVMHIAGQSTGVTGEGGEGRRLPAYWFESRRRYFLKNYGLSYAAAADGLSLLGMSLYKMRNLIQRRADGRPPNYMRDLLNHSVVWPRNRQIPHRGED